MTPDKSWQMDTLIAERWRALRDWAPQISLRARRHADQLIMLATKGALGVVECTRLHDGYLEMAHHLSKVISRADPADECRMSWLRYQYDRHNEIADAMFDALDRQHDWLKYADDEDAV